MLFLECIKDGYTKTDNQLLQNITISKNCGKIAIQRMKKKDYIRELRKIIPLYKTRSYNEWKERIGQDSETIEYKSRNGSICQILISANWNKNPDDIIKISFAIDHGGWASFFPFSVSICINPNNEYLSDSLEELS